VFTPPSGADADATKQFRRVGVGGVYWALRVKNQNQKTAGNLPEIFHELGLAVLHLADSSLEGVVDGVGLFADVPGRIVKDVVAQRPHLYRSHALVLGTRHVVMVELRPRLRRRLSATYAGRTGGVKSGSSRKFPSPIGVGDGDSGELVPPPTPKFRGKYFSGKLLCKIRAFAGKNRVKFGILC